MTKSKQYFHWSRLGPLTFLPVTSQVLNYIYFILKRTTVFDKLLTHISYELYHLNPQ